WVEIANPPDVIEGFALESRQLTLHRKIGGAVLAETHLPLFLVNLANVFSRTARFHIVHSDIVNFVFINGREFATKWLIHTGCPPGCEDKAIGEAFFGGFAVPPAVVSTTRSERQHGGCSGHAYDHSTSFHLELPFGV